MSNACQRVMIIMVEVNAWFRLTFQRRLMGGLRQVTIVGIASVVCLVYGGREEKSLLDTLFANYQVLERPVINESTPINVSLGLTLQQIVDIDEKNQVIKNNIWLTFSWVDEFLQWDPPKFGGIRSIRLPPDQVWRPDVLLYNSVDENFDTTYAANVIVEYDGTVKWLPPGIVTSTCKIDITWLFGAWTHHGFLVDLRVGDIDLETYTKNGEFELIDVQGVRNTFMYDCCPEFYPDITFYIVVRRRTLYYGFNLIIPCLLISLMTVLDFILPPDSGEKLTLGISIFMSLCVFLLMVAELLPPTSDAVPLIGVYFSSVMIIVSASQVFTVLVLNFHNRSPVTHEMSPFMEQLFLNWLPWLLLMKRPGYIVCRAKLVKQSASDGLLKLPRDITMETTVSFTSSAPLLSYIKESTVPRSISWYDECVPNDSHLNADGYAPACTRMELFSGVEILLASVLKEIAFINRKMQEEHEEESIVKDWKFAAMVLDRLCLYLFLGILSLSTCAIIFAAPYIAA